MGKINKPLKAEYVKTSTNVKMAKTVKNCRKITKRKPSNIDNHNTTVKAVKNTQRRYRPKLIKSQNRQNVMLALSFDMQLNKENRF